MKLKEWIGKKRGRAAQLARDVGVTPGHISMAAARIRRPSPEVAERIERATSDEVTVMELLFPDREAQKEVT